MADSKQLAEGGDMLMLIRDSRQLLWVGFRFSGVKKIIFIITG